MHRISRITTNFGGKSSTAPLPPLAPRKNCKLGALTIPWRGNLRFTKTNIWSLPSLRLWKLLILSPPILQIERDEKVQAVVMRRTGPGALIGDNIRDLWRPGPAVHISDRISSTSISSKTPIMIWMRIFCCTHFVTKNPRKWGLIARESDFESDWPILSINEIMPR